MLESAFLTIRSYEMYPFPLHPVQFVLVFTIPSLQLVQFVYVLLLFTFIEPQVLQYLVLIPTPVMIPTI